LFAVPPKVFNFELLIGNVFSMRSLSPMERVFLAIICSGIILLVTALALQTPDAGALTIAVQQRVLPR
jgi:hypothetical protein